jgi:PadR family transcriptional regulator, regulatory protein PadR
VTDFRAALVQGTLDMMVLKILTLEPLHGWGISAALGAYSGDVFRINQGSLYIALDRLQRRGLISSAWRVTENNRRAKYYSLTRAGRAELARAFEQWEISASAVDLVMSLQPR